MFLENKLLASQYGSNDWVCVNSNLYVTQTSPGWIDVGTYAGFFNYIAVVAYYDDYPSLLEIDSVLVIPQPNQFSKRYYAQSIVSSSEYGGGHVGNEEGILHSFERSNLFLRGFC
jgi:hypothetical protein